MVAQTQMDQNLLLLSLVATGILFLLSLALYRNNRSLRDAKRLIENAEDLRRTFINSQEELVYLKDTQRRECIPSRLGYCARPLFH